MKGAGPAGGLLFLAVLAFVGWLVVTELRGAARYVMLAAVVVAAFALAADVRRRR